jgi:hypothetical protein
LNNIFEKNVDAHHAIVSKRFKEEMNKLMQGKEKMRPTKKKQNVYGGSISKIIVVKNTLKKDEMLQKTFFEDMGLLIVRNNLPI